MKKLLISLLTVCVVLSFSLETTTAKENDNRIVLNQLKQVKKLAAHGLTLQSKNIKLGDPYKKPYAIFGNPIYTREFKGAVFIDYYYNGITIISEGNILSDLTLIRNKYAKIQSIQNNFVVSYKDIKKIFGKSKWSYATLDYYVIYRSGQNIIYFNTDLDTDKKKIGSEPRVDSLFTSYSISKY